MDGHPPEIMEAMRVAAETRAGGAYAQSTPALGELAKQPHASRR